MLRRVFVTLQRSHFIANLTRSFLVCSSTQKVHYHPAITCWREIELDKNPFYDKYKDKLRHVISNVSHNDDAVDLDNKTVTMDSGNKTQSSHYSFTTLPQLDKIMNVELLVDKTADEIAQIWKTYHSDKDSVCAIIPVSCRVVCHPVDCHVSSCGLSCDVLCHPVDCHGKQFDEMTSMTQQCPLFLHPVPRSEGFEMILSQFDGSHYCYFTSLLNYKTHRDTAPVWLTLVHYTELLESKGIVLMAGDIDTKYLSVLEAQFLANQIQLYYATGNEERHNLLQQFNHKPDSFDYTKLLELVPQSKST